MLQSFVLVLFLKGVAKRCFRGGFLFFFFFFPKIKTRIIPGKLMMTGIYLL